MLTASSDQVVVRLGTSALGAVPAPDDARLCRSPRRSSSTGTATGSPMSSPRRAGPVALAAGPARFAGPIRGAAGHRPEPRRRASATSRWSTTRYGTESWPRSTRTSPWSGCSATPRGRAAGSSRSRSRCRAPALLVSIDVGRTRQRRPGRPGAGRPGQRPVDRARSVSPTARSPRTRARLDVGYAPSEVAIADLNDRRPGRPGGLQHLLGRPQRVLRRSGPAVRPRGPARRRPGRRRSRRPGRRPGPAHRRRADRRDRRRLRRLGTDRRRLGRRAGPTASRSSMARPAAGSPTPRSQRATRPASTRPRSWPPR